MTERRKTNMAIAVTRSLCFAQDRQNALGWKDKENGDDVDDDNRERATAPEKKGKMLRDLILLAPFLFPASSVVPFCLACLHDSPEQYDRKALHFRLVMRAAERWSQVSSAKSLSKHVHRTEISDSLLNDHVRHDSVWLIRVEKRKQSIPFVTCKVELDQSGCLEQSILLVYLFNMSWARASESENNSGNFLTEARMNTN